MFCVCVAAGCTVYLLLYLDCVISSPFCLLCEFSGPLLCDPSRLIVVVSPLLGNGGVQRIVGVGILEKQLNGQTNLVDLQGRRPDNRKQEKQQKEKKKTRRKSREKDKEKKTKNRKQKRKMKMEEKQKIAKENSCE